MKKIRSIMQLELEQARLRLREAELEKTIKKDWQEVKESLTPKNLGKQILSGFIDQKIQDKIKSNDILSGSLAYGAAMLTKKLVEKAVEKFKIFSGKKHNEN